MSTLFDTYYDSFGHELRLGDIVLIRSCGQLIWGTLVKFDRNKKGDIRYNVIPSAKYLANGIQLKRNYKVSEFNIFLGNIKKKN